MPGLLERLRGALRTLGILSIFGDRVARVKLPVAQKCAAGSTYFMGS
jgi:hypothetical protein